MTDELLVRVYPQVQEEGKKKAGEAGGSMSDRRSVINFHNFKQPKLDTAGSEGFENRIVSSVSVSRKSKRPESKPFAMSQALALRSAEH